MFWVLIWGLELPPERSGPHSCADESLPLLQGLGILSVWVALYIMGVPGGEASVWEGGAGPAPVAGVWPRGGLSEPGPRLADPSFWGPRSQVDLPGVLVSGEEKVQEGSGPVGMGRQNSTIVQGTAASSGMRGASAALVRPVVALPVPPVLSLGASEPPATSSWCVGLVTVAGIKSGGLFTLSVGFLWREGGPPSPRGQMF